MPSARQIGLVSIVEEVRQDKLPHPSYIVACLQERISGSFVKDSILVHIGQSFDPHKEGFFRLRSRAFWLLPVDFMKHCFQLLLKDLVFSPLVELAYEVAADFECIVCEVEGGATQILISVSNEQ